ncbi:MAG: hypothetical protein DCC49_09575 [Acidobacteria bacterium]|nr:MAG: hypothetical protein DCC49_09575 [Acidobacteriota bacterium]
MKLRRGENLEVFRPRTAGEVVDAAFAIFRNQPGRIIATILPVLLAVESLALIGQLNALKGLRDAFRHGLFALPVPIWVTAGENLLSLVAWILEFMITFAAVTAAAEAYLGRTIDVGGCYRTIAKKSGTALLVMLLWSSVVFGPMILSVIVLVGANAGFGLLTMFVTGPWTIWAFVTFRLAPAAVIIEDASPITAMRRSHQLTKNSWWRTFGIIFLAEVISWVVNTGLQIVILLLTSSRAPSGAGFYGIAAAMLLLPAITVRPFAAIVDLCLYFDLRVRREALDIDAACALADTDEFSLHPKIAEAKWAIPWSPVPSAFSGRRP